MIHLVKIAVAIFAFLIGSGPALAQMCQMAEPRPATLSQVATARSGSSIEMILEVKSVNDNQTLSATLLERIDRTHYRRSKKLVSVAYGSETRVVMGKEADLKAGTVVQTNGVVTKPYALDAKRFVVLSSFVHVE